MTGVAKRPARGDTRRGGRELNHIDDGKGEEIDVLVNFVDGISPFGEEKLAFTYIPLAEGSISSFKDKGAPIRRFWTGAWLGDIKIKIFQNGLQTNTLANEFGDIDYALKYVSPNDPNSYEKW
jgi:hypothetical protein